MSLRVGLAVLIGLLCFPIHPVFGQATYRAFFDATWSQETHPNAYDLANAHFSPLIGGTHDESVSFWEPGGIATPGIESMAESGSTFSLRLEIDGTVGSQKRLSGGGPDSPGSETIEFDVTADAPLVTLVTMIAPSPDWFVGVHGLSLRDGDGWATEVTEELFAYDAGTDSGAALRSTNADVTPHEPIALVGAPFDGLPSLATLTFTLQSITGDFDGDLALTVADIDALMSEVVSGGSGAEFDLNGDGAVDLADRDAWLASAGQFPVGDLNLDTAIDSTDLGLLLNNFADSNAVAYQGGELNGDGVVDSTDLGLLLNQFGTAAANASAVPEPGGFGLALWTLLTLSFACRLRRKSSR